VSRDLGQEEGNSDAGRYLEISPELAKQRGIQTGQWLRVESRWGSLEVKALVTDRVSSNQVFLAKASTRRKDDGGGFIAAPHALDGHSSKLP
jgi:predicted molibdopterin-dependent oxidoreductase YjgC